MKIAKKIKVLFLVLVVGLCTLGVYFFYIKKSSDLVFFGNVEIKEADLSFNVTGKVQKMFFEEGDYVKKGDVLAKINPEIYNDTLIAAQQTLKAMEAEFRKAKLDLSMHETSYRKRLISKKEYTDFSTIVKSMGYKLDAQRAQMRIAKSHLVDATLKAPSDGVIITKVFEEGSVVQVGQPVYTLLLQADVKIRSYINEVDLGKIYYGMPVKIETDGGDKYDGQIGFISSKAEFTPKSVETQQLRSDLVYRFKVIVKNPDNKLKQGMPITIIPIKSDCQNNEQHTN